MVPGETRQKVVSTGSFQYGPPEIHSSLIKTVHRPALPPFSPVAPVGIIAPVRMGYRRYAVARRVIWDVPEQEFRFFPLYLGRKCLQLGRSVRSTPFLEICKTSPNRAGLYF